MLSERAVALQTPETWITGQAAAEPVELQATFVYCLIVIICVFSGPTGTCYSLVVVGSESCLKSLRPLKRTVTVPAAPHSSMLHDKILDLGIIWLFLVCDHGKHRNAKLYNFGSNLCFIPVPKVTPKMVPFCKICSLHKFIIRTK